MRFCCPQCGREDEVIGDQNPSCLYCREKLVKATNSYRGLWLSPQFVIERMQRVIEKHGIREAHTNGRFKQEREAYTSAVWALGQSEMHGREHWVEIETLDQTPDTKVHYLDQSDGNNHKKTYNIEVVDWEEHVDDPIGLIGAKCAKAYPSYFWLLVMARSGKTLSPEWLAGEVKRLKVPFVEIWILGRALDLGTQYYVARLYPSLFLLQFDLERVLQKQRNNGKILQPQKRGKGTEFRDLGQIYMPIP